MEIAKESLEEWKMKGYSYEEMAEAAGVSVSTVLKFLRKYGMTQQKRVKEEDIKNFCEMRQDGYTINRIAELTGYGYSTVMKALKKEGLTKKPEIQEVKDLSDYLPKNLRFAEKKKPRIIRIMVGGRRYLDETDIWIPR